MDDFHRIELAILHNRELPCRRLGDAVWTRVLAKMSNRNVDRVKPVCRYFAAIGMECKPKEGFCAEDARLLADVAPLVGEPPVRDALRRFARNLLLCVHCGKRDSNKGQRHLLALPSCGHPVCSQCWTSDATDLENTMSNTTTGRHAWSNFYMKCDACGRRNEMDDGEWQGDAWEDCMHSLEGRTLVKLDRLPAPPICGRSASGPAPAPASVEVALRVDAMAERFLELNRFLLGRYGNPPVIATVRRELAVGALWLERASGRASKARPGRFAWA